MNTCLLQCTNFERKLNFVVIDTEHYISIPVNQMLQPRDWGGGRRLRSVYALSLLSHRITQTYNILLELFVHNIIILNVIPDQLIASIRLANKRSNQRDVTMGRLCVAFKLYLWLRSLLRAWSQAQIVQYELLHDRGGLNCGLGVRKPGIVNFMNNTNYSFYNFLIVALFFSSIVTSLILKPSTLHIVCLSRTLYW